MGNKEQAIKQSGEVVLEQQSGMMTPEAILSNLKHLAAMNNVFVTVLETTPSSDPVAAEFNRRQFLAIFAETDVMMQKETGEGAIREYLHRAVSVGKEMVYFPCRICCLTPSDGEELLAKYAEASRAIRETAAVRELFRAEGYPLPQYLSAKTVAALCHFREKLYGNTLQQEVRKRYVECLHRLVQEAGQREGGLER